MNKPIVLTLFLMACGNTSEPQEIAELIYQFYGAEENCYVPVINVVYESSCQGHPDLIESEGRCLYGYYSLYNHQVFIAWRGKWSDTAISHELLHSWQWCRHIYDLDHQDQEWKTYPAYGNEVLRAFGY